MTEKLWHQEPGTMVADDGYRGHPIEDFIENGFLWAINTFIMHPRGYALLAIWQQEPGSKFIGFQVLPNDGVPQTYPDDNEHAMLMGLMFADSFPSPPTEDRS